MSQCLGVGDEPAAAKMWRWAELGAWRWQLQSTNQLITIIYVAPYFESESETQSLIGSPWSSCIAVMDGRVFS